MKNDKQIAERLKNLVEQRGFSAIEFAEYLGVSAPNMSGYLNGKRPLGIKVIDKIKEFIPNLDLNWLLYGQSPEQYVNEPSSDYNTVNPIEDYIKTLVDSKYEKVTYKIDTLEKDFKNDILELKSTLDISSEDSEMILKLKQIIKKNTQ